MQKLLIAFFFTDRYRAFSAGNAVGLAFPGPMSCTHNLLGGVFVALEAGPGDIRSGFKRTLDDSRMVGVGDFQGNISPGI